MLHGKRRFPCRKAASEGPSLCPLLCPSALRDPLPVFKARQGRLREKCFRFPFPWVPLVEIPMLAVGQHQDFSSAFAHASSPPPLPLGQTPVLFSQPPGNPLTRSWDLGPGWPVWFPTSASSLRLGVNGDVRGSTKHSSGPGAPRDGSSFPDPGGWKLCHASLCVPTSCAPTLAPRQAGPSAGGPHAQTRVAVGAVGVSSAIPPRVTSKAREG